MTSSSIERRIWRSRCKWWKQLFTTFVMCCLKLSSLSRYTPRSRTTSLGLMTLLPTGKQRSEPEILLRLARLPNQAISVFAAFNWSLRDAHQVVKYGSVFWELTHWNLWRLLCSVSRKQLLITTSSQIWYIRNTKENNCLKLKKLHDSCSWSFIQSIQKSLQICVRWFRPISSVTSIIRMCWPNVACCVMGVCGKLQM